VHNGRSWVISYHFHLIVIYDFTRLWHFKHKAGFPGFILNPGFEPVGILIHRSLVLPSKTFLVECILSYIPPANSPPPPLFQKRGEKKLKDLFIPLLFEKRRG
jgi:hypothetical protein